MWIFNTDQNKWFSNTDTISKDNFEYLKQELASTRFYSKCLSGATYIPVNDLDNIYDILGEYKPRNWFVNQEGSIYTNTTIPLLHNSPINNETSYEYYTKYLSEYGLTLKNLFTPERLIKDANKNFIYVDIATTEQISNLGVVFNELIIDGIKVVNNHRILIKDQISTISLPFDTDPNTYFKGSYTVVQDYGTTILYSYYNSDNAIYTFNNGRLFKTDDLSDYADCIRYSVSVKEGITNTQKQYHLNRLLNGYYPTTSLNEPIEFKEKHNWLLRHRVDYNNLFEINYYDVIKYKATQYNIAGITYSIPERTLSIGEFGVILNNQYGISNIIPNKYKVNLRSITDIDMFYWICGDDGILLKVSKHNFAIEKIETNVDTNLKSVSFFNNLKGIVVGDLNTILITKDGGVTWDKVIIEEFTSFIYNKAIFYSSNKIYIVGNSGVFLELQEGLSGWDIYKRRVSRFIDDYEEYLLVDNINDIYKTTISDWDVTLPYLNEICGDNKELLFLTTEESKIIIYDVNNSIPNFDFIFLDFNKKYGNIKSIIRLEGNFTSNYFYFNWNDGQTQGISLFDLNQFTTIGIDNKYSNTSYVNNDAKIISRLFTNKIFNYNGEQLLICGNDSLLKYSNYTIYNITTSIPIFNVLDDTFEKRLKSKMLFLDYDIASKLNFFTDAGDYRLPNTAVFDLSLSNPPIVFSSNSLNTDIYSNTVISTPIVVTGLDLDVVPKTIDVTVNLSNDSLSNLIINLKAPDGKIINLKSTDNAFGNTFSNVTFTTAENYTKFSLNLDTVYTNKKYQMDKFIGVGSVGYISNTDSISDLDDTLNGVWTLYVVSNSFTPSQSVTGKLNNWKLAFTYQLVNQISLTSSVSQLWFNPLTISATAPSFMTQSETNWLTYWSDSSKTFEYYDSILPLDNSSKILMSTTFSYKDYDTKIILQSTGVTNSITQVSRLAPSVLDNINSKFNAQGSSNILPPTANYKLYLYDYIMIIRVDTIYPVNIGDIIRLESDIIDGNFMVNKIITLNNISPPPASSKFIYLFTNFNDNIITNLTKTSSNITITNLNKYKNISELQSRFNIHPISNGYDFVYATSSYYDDSRGKSFNADTINISAKFNNLTSYYNLATNVTIHDNNLGNLLGTMSYKDSFLKFGYTPTYNILDYLEKISDNTNPKFYADKEYVAMPNYVGIPIRGAGDFLPSQIFILYNGMQNSGYINGIVQSNKMFFGIDLKLEWESIFLNTFIDVKIHTNSNSYITEKLLVMKKYFDTIDGIDVYVIEFHKKLNYNLNEQQITVDITSRRKLSQISSDLQELNNIQRSKNINGSTIVYGSNFYNYEKELNFKISTDSYAKILLSDVDTIKEISAIIYIDYKNELAMNVTRLEKEYNIPIQDTFSYIPVGSSTTKFFIRCTQNHDLKTGDAVVLEFTGTSSHSSSVLNQQYYGYHNITVLNSSGFFIDTPYGVDSVGDTGFVKYTRRDPFFNYQPIDITDIGIDKRGKNAIELSIDNLKLSGEVYSLNNIDFNKFRYRLVDGLTIDTLSLKYPWILEAEITDAIIGTDGKNLVWYKGVWECGRWFDGIWHSGTWKSGDWYGGIWNAKKIVDNLISVDVANNTSNKELSSWYGGRWYDGIWNDGTWNDGRWYGGTWSKGTWNNGTWNDGTWNSGDFSGGIWVDGTWNSGIMNCNNQPTYWINGKWCSGDFENGMWYNGIFEEKNGPARFGTKAFNSRAATWHSGKWLSGSFYSRLDDTPDISISHKYSIWYTGSWYSGDIYGGVVYDIDFKSGTWHGGILEDIQIININVKEGYIKLNGIFKFNIGDEISILGNDSFYKEYFKSIRYKVLHTSEDSVNKYTKVYIKFESVPNFNYYDILDKDTNMKVVSRFRNVNWLSGVWTNGIFETGSWKGGIWYNGEFGIKAKWS